LLSARPYKNTVALPRLEKLCGNVTDRNFNRIRTLHAPEYVGGAFAHTIKIHPEGRLQSAFTAQ